MLHLRPNSVFSHLLLILSIVFIGQFFITHQASAEDSGPIDLTPDAESEGELSGCATDTWNAMVNHAVNQTRRENAFNKRYIVKPDSVLTYICFNRDIQAVADHIDPLFSGSDHWADRDVDVLSTSGDYLDGEPVNIRIYEESQDVEADYRFEYLTTETLEESLVLVVDSAWRNYRRGQFNHRILAGTVPGLGNGLMACRNMAAIWDAAKCNNFDGLAIWPTFREMAAGIEPREFPPNMPCL